MDGRGWVATVGVLLLAASGCSIVNDIDVCDRRIQEESVVNVRTDGDQRIESLQAVTPTPEGDAVLVAYLSGGAGTGSTLTTSFMAASGDPLATCGEDSGYDVTPVIEGVGHPSVAFAPEPHPDQDVVGLLVYTQQISAAASPSFEVVGVALRRSACPFEFLSRCERSGERFVIATEAGMPGEAPKIVPFGADGYVVVWTRSFPGRFDPDAALRARRIRFDLCPDFPGNDFDSSGGTVNLTVEGNQPTRVSVAPAGDGRFFALWYEERADGFDVMAAAFEETLEVVVPPFIVASSDTRAPELLHGPLDPSFRTSVAWDGRQLLAAWVERQDTGGPSRVLGRFIDPEGGFLSSEDAPDGEPFRIGSASMGSEADPAVSALAQGGFLAVWTERQEPGRDDASGSGIRAALFTPRGARSFSNATCRVGDFQLNRLTADEQSAPAVTQLPGGASVVVWNDLSQTPPDRDGSAVRGVFLPERTLLPLE